MKYSVGIQWLILKKDDTNFSVVIFWCRQFCHIKIVAIQWLTKLPLKFYVAIQWIIRKKKSVTNFLVANFPWLQFFHKKMLVIWWLIKLSPKYLVAIQWLEKNMIPIFRWLFGNKLFCHKISVTIQCKFCHWNFLWQNFNDRMLIF